MLFPLIIIIIIIIIIIGFIAQATSSLSRVASLVAFCCCLSC